MGAERARASRLQLRSSPSLCYGTGTNQSVKEDTR
jgi:hypothetical protein